jgi:hypothetical protein
VGVLGDCLGVLGDRRPSRGLGDVLGDRGPSRGLFGRPRGSWAF